MSSGSSGSNTIAPTTTAASSSDVTSNWAGYVASSGTYSGVSGSWNVPSVSGSGDTSADATWVGIGGVSTDDLIQVGTQNVVSPNGSVESSAFYEMLPDTSITIPNVSLSAGDAITASIANDGGDQWTITLKDTTNGESYSTVVSYDSSESSAEWIEEDPSDGASQIPLDNFGTVTITNGSAMMNGSKTSILGSGAQAATMANDEGQPLISVSALTGSASFSVTRTSATTVAAIPQFNSDPRGWARRGSPFDRFSGGSEYPSRQYGFTTNVVYSHEYRGFR